MRSAFGATEVERARAYRATLCARLGIAAESAVVAAPPADPVLFEIAASGAIAGLARAVLSSEVTCFGVTYLDKAAWTGPAARWHQDGGPWRDRLAGAEAVTVWVALTKADESSGALCAVPGSHVLEPQPLVPDDGSSLFGVGMDEDLVDVSRSVTLVVEAGDAVVHHHQLIHGSFPNRSAQRRLALAFRFAVKR